MKPVKTTNKYIISSVLALCAMVVFGYVHSMSDPLAGWKDLGSANVLKGCPFGQKIKDDYENYIPTLPEYERNSVDDNAIHFYQGTDGRRAVKITAFGKGFITHIWWEYILIYDSNDKRIKAIKHKNGRSMS
jgi:hypothetical protein